MTHSPANMATGSVLLIGASRGLGLGMAGEFARRGWHVVATVRDGARTELHALAEAQSDRIAVETVDITQPDQIADLYDRLADRSFDMLFVNAGTAPIDDAPAGAIASDEYARVLVTNALGPVRMIEACQDLVLEDGLIGVMSSGQGSITNNSNGLHEVYRSSKAALNQLVRSYAARHAHTARALVLLAPGWIRTSLGGPRAPFGVDESVPLLVDVLVARLGKAGLAFVDRDGNIVPW